MLSGALLHSVLVCAAGHAAEDLLHLPRMLHNPSAQAAGFNTAVLLRLLTLTLKFLAGGGLPQLLHMLHTCAGPQEWLHCGTSQLLLSSCCRGSALPQANCCCIDLCCIVAQASCCCPRAGLWHMPTAS